MTPSLRVATLNLAKGELRWGERAPLLMEQLVAVRPDIVGFQEIDLRIDQGNWLYRRFNDLIGYEAGGDLNYEPGSGALPYRMHHIANPRDRVAVEALGIMTHLPVIAHEGFDYLFRNRVAHRVRVELQGSTIDFYNTHFHHEQDRTGNEVRAEQAKRLVRWMDTHGWDVPKIAVGDFNAPPGTRPIRLMEERLISAYKVVHGKEPDITIPTPLFPPERWPPNWPRSVAVDYIFVSPSVRVTDARVVFDRCSEADAELYASDHFGLVADLDFH